MKSTKEQEGGRLESLLKIYMSPMMKADLNDGFRDAVKVALAHELHLDWRLIEAKLDFSDG